ncbi:hypothetical protein, partial [Streptococcus phage LF3]
SVYKRQILALSKFKTGGVHKNLKIKKSKINLYSDCLNLNLFYFGKFLCCDIQGKVADSSLR